MKINYHNGSWFSYITVKPLGYYDCTEFLQNPTYDNLTWGDYLHCKLAACLERTYGAVTLLRKDKNYNQEHWNNLTYIHDLRLQHLSLARLAVGSHGDAGCWIPNHSSLDWPVHGTGGSSTGDSHSRILWCPFPRWHRGPGSITTNHSCRQAKGNWEMQ